MPMNFSYEILAKLHVCFPVNYNSLLACTYNPHNSVYCYVYVRGYMHTWLAILYNYIHMHAHIVTYI